MRLLLASLATACVLVGLLGVRSYLNDYDQHRGFTIVPRLPGAAIGRLLTVHFYSRALGREADYLVYLPGGYRSSSRYPVFYLLHGVPGQPSAFADYADIGVRLDNLISQRRMRPMILVFPDGRINGNAFSDSEWANTPSGAFESYVIDVAHDVDQRFATIPSRQARVIGGLSAGGYGAINVALHDLATFGSVEVWSGYFIQTRSGVFANATPSQLADNSPLDLVGRLSRQVAADRLRVFLYAGQLDPYARQIKPMTVALKHAGAISSYAIYPGGHDWQLWNDHIDQMLILASEDVSVTPPPKRGRHAGSTIAATTPRLPPAPGLATRERPRRLSRRGDAHRRMRRGDTQRRSRIDTRARRSPGRLLLGLLLALVSAAAINIGFLLQHRGLSRVSAASGRGWLGNALRSRTWLSGQAIGWIGFAAQIVAVALAPLSMVQAFAAGGLALSVPIAAGLFGHRLRARQMLAVLAIAAGLSALPIAASAHREHLYPDHLAVTVAVSLCLAVPIAVRGNAAMKAIAAGLLYGIADAGIKALCVTWQRGGGTGSMLVWLGLATVGTIGGFFAFQAALRDDRPVSAISLMNGLAALAALGCGILAFGETLGQSPAVLAFHLLAVGLLLACVPVLAAAHSEMATPRSVSPAGASAVL